MTSALFPPDALHHAKVFGSRRLRADGELLALGFSSDGSLYSVEEPGVLRHWNPKDGEQLEWQPLSDLETLWCFSDDARVLASASNDLSFWDPTSGNLLTALPASSWVTALAFHPDPAFAATGHDDGVVRLWDVAGHQLVREFRLHQRPISALAISPDASRLAAASEDKVITLWEIESGKHIGDLQGHTDRIPALAWHPSSQFLVSAGWDTTARVWDAETLEPTILLNTHAAQVTALAFTRDGARLATADSDLRIHLWDFDSKKTLRIFTGPQAEIRSLAFSPDGKQLGANGDTLIHLWDPDTGEGQAESTGSHAARASFALSPDGNRLVSNGGGSSVRVWNTQTLQSETVLPEDHTVYGLACSPDGRYAAGAAADYVRLWDLTTGKPGATLEASDEPLTSVAFANDSQTVAAASNLGMRVWIFRVSDGEPILLIPDALDGCSIEAVAFNPKKPNLVAAGGIDWLATGGCDGAVCIWDIAERCEVTTFPGGCTSIAFHPDGRRLAASMLDYAICIWDINSKELAAELIGHEGAIAALAYSPDGSLLASGGDERILRLWNSDGEEVATIELDSQIRGLAFSPDGKLLYTANANTTCYQLELQRILSSSQ